MQYQKQYEPILFEIELVINNWAYESMHSNENEIFNVLGFLLTHTIDWNNFEELLQSNQCMKLNSQEQELLKLLLGHLSKYYSENHSLTPLIFVRSLRIIYNSVIFWTKQKGSKGYLNHIREFLPIGTEGSHPHRFIDFSRPIETRIDDSREFEDYEELSSDFFL